MYSPLEHRGTSSNEEIGVRISHTGLQNDTKSEAVAGIDTLISLGQTILPRHQAGIIIGRLEGAAVDKAKVGSSLTDEGLFSSVLKVGTDTRQIDHNGDAERLEFLLWPNSTELEDLGSVECAAGYDDLASDSDVSVTRGARNGVASRVGTVETLALDEFDSSGDGNIAAFIEDDFGDLRKG